MNRKQIFAIFSPILVLFTMYPIFHFLSILFHDNWRIGWLIGLMIYWLLWGFGYSILAIGKKNIRKLLHPQKLNIRLVLFILFPIFLSIIFKLIPAGITYDKPDKFILLLLIFSVFGNGLFEEIYWRGVYMKLFEKNLLFRIIWPSIWFGIWHYVPGSLNPDSSHVIGLMIGAVFLGIYSSFIAWRTNTLWWSIIIHVTGGMIVVI